MRSLHSFIVKSNQVIKETLSYGSLNLITPEVVHRHNEYDYINWEMEVVSIPEWWDIDCEIGDKIICHHNVYINQKNSLNAEDLQTTRFGIDLDEGLYYIPYEPNGRNNLAYARIDKNGDIHTLGDVILCEIPEPKTQEEITTKSGIILTEEIIDDRLELDCLVAYSNPFSESKGAVAGGRVSLSTDSDYKISIQGKDYWRIFDNDIRYLNGDIFQPYGDSICIELNEVEHTTTNGIYMPLKDGSRSTVCTIRAIGYEDEDLKVGDRLF